MTTPNTGAPGSQQGDTISRSGPGAARQPGAVQPQAPITPAAPAAPADPVAEAKKYQEVAQAQLNELAKRARVHAAEIKKFKEDKTGLGAKLTEYEQLKKQVAESTRLDGQAKLNKAAFLEAKFGKDWYDQIVQEKLNGGAPTADTIALEVSKVEERLEAKFAKEREERAAADQQAQQQHVQNELQQFRNESAAFARASVKDYPIFEKLGDERAVGQLLVQRIQQEHDRTIQRDPVTRQVVVPGRVLSFKEAADALETDLLGIAEHAFGAEKYRPKLTEKLKPANTGAAGGVPQLRSTEERRTLSNGLTATTPGQKRTSRSDDERRAAAFAAVDAVKNRQA